MNFLKQAWSSGKLFLHPQNFTQQRTFEIRNFAFKFAKPAHILSFMALLISMSFCLQKCKKRIWGSKLWFVEFQNDIMQWFSFLIKQPTFVEIKNIFATAYLEFAGANRASGGNINLLQRLSWIASTNAVWALHASPLRPANGASVQRCSRYNVIGDASILAYVLGRA